MPGTDLCFLQKTNKKSFNSANNDCDSLAPLDGYLAKVENKNIYDYIKGQWGSQE